MGIIPKWMKFAIGGGYDAISSAYFARMATQPSVDFKKVIDTYFFRNSKVINGTTITTKQILSKLKFFPLGNINDSNDSFINTISNNYHGTKDGSGLVWDDKWGYSNPYGTGYIDIAFNPAVDGGSLFTQNSAGFGIYLHNNNTATNRFVMGVKNTNYIAFKANSESFAINQAALLSRANVPFRAGLHGFFRTASNAINAKNQNLVNTTGTNASTSIPSGNIRLFDCNGESAPYTGGLSCPFGGGVLTDDEFTALNLIVNEYLKHSIYLKYGADNWGVKMAKSYFDTLHNFEPYEAWEIYEFIKRHQPDYVDSTGTGYLYNTFGPNGQNKTVADYIMLFKAGGNLASNAWAKTGATLRWNQDGSITSSNTMPAYARGTNLGIVTVTSTDGWNGVTGINLQQTSNSINSFYGNIPIILGLLKMSGGKTTFNVYQNRARIYLSHSIKDICLGLRLQNPTFPGGVRINITNLIGGSYSDSININGKLVASLATWSIVEGDISQFTTEFVNSTNFTMQINGDYSITGNLQGIVLNNNTRNLFFQYTSINSGISNWHKEIINFDISNCILNTSAVNNQLAVGDNYYVGAVVPIKVQTVNLSGTTMGIPTGGANNTNLLSWVAKGSAVGFPPVITVRTT